MTPQEIFDTVANHLRKQDDVSVDDGVCQYVNSYGLKCAVGCLFSATEYSSSMEGKNLERLQREELLPTRLIPHVELLKQLQYTHDNYGVSKWEEELQFVANSFGLDFKMRNRT